MVYWNEPRQSLRTSNISPNQGSFVLEAVNVAQEPVCRVPCIYIYIYIDILPEIKGFGVVWKPLRLMSVNQHYRALMHGSSAGVRLFRVAIFEYIGGRCHCIPRFWLLRFSSAATAAGWQKRPVGFDTPRLPATSRTMLRKPANVLFNSERPSPHDVSRGLEGTYLDRKSMQNNSLW